MREALGREGEAIARAQGQTMGTLEMDGERVQLPRYSAILPMRGFVGDIEQACLTAGQSAGNIDAVLPAAEIVQQMTAEAVAALSRFGMQRLAA